MTFPLNALCTVYIRIYSISFNVSSVCLSNYKSFSNYLNGLVPMTGLEPVRYRYQRIFLLLYVTIALIKSAARLMRNLKFSHLSNATACCTDIYIKL